MKAQNCVVIITFILWSVTSQVSSNKAPYFMNSWQWTIKENEELGSRPVSATSINREEIKLRAYDYENDLLHYGVIGEIGERYFTVDELTGVVKVRRKFDYEVDSNYRAKFFVSDGTNRAEMEADIIVQDVNDNAPTFDQFPYEVEVPEDTGSGVQITRIRTDDPDTGYGGVVKYYFEEGFKGPFSLDPDSGILRLRERIDFEKTQSYQFKVIAMDQDILNPLSSTVPVIVNVVDIQDTDPIFQDLPYDRSIPENSRLGSDVVRLKAVDGDLSRPNDISYSIISGNEDGIFMLVSSVGNVRIATQKLDRDVKGFDGIYPLTVRATETGSGAFSDISFDITILDVNDEKPKWNRRRYRLSVPEDTPTGTRLPVNMRVEDLDQGLNSELTITVDPNHMTSFAVTPALFRGSSDVTLILMAPLDYEENSRIQLQIFANETQLSDHYGVAEVIIDIENVNDNKPVFQKPLYNINIPENTTLNSMLLRVVATDKDEGKFGNLLYSISDSSKNFAIDPQTGEILLVGRLDREEVYQYSILVSASDGGSPPNRATAAVTIRITDVNDNVPQFDRLSYMAYVTENEEMKEPIAVVRAIDVDASPNNEITYDIIKSSNSQYFKVLKSPEGLGLVYLKEPLDFESLENEIIKLQILAIDSGAPPMNSTAPLVVTVADANDNRPSFTEDSTFNISVLENLGGGVSVGHVSAVDLDRAANGQIRYYIMDSIEFDDVFRLDDQTGDITIKPGSSPDHETMSFYNVTVVAEDGGNPSLSAKHSLFITIQDINDNSPEFAQERYSVTAREGMASWLLRVTATDKDAKANGRIRYSIAEGNDDRTFAIDPLVGDIVAIKPLDYEATSGSYRLLVAATDQSSNIRERRTTKVQVIVDVIDVNDNSPEFVINDPEQQIVYDVTEGVEGPRVARFTATDADAGKNGYLTYSICGGNEKDLFSISHSGGELRVRSGQELDREVKPFHLLKICATDAGDVQRNATIQVTIRVLDTNDNAPTFVTFDPIVNISESSKVGSVVTRVIANDLDSGEYRKVSYEISSGNEDGIFIIGARTGFINLVKVIDRESVPFYDLEILVKDNPRDVQNSRRTMKKMKVVIIDVNDQTPRFVGKTPYHAEVNENSTPGTNVDVTGDPITAHDADVGRNALVTYSIRSDDIAFLSNFVTRHDITFFTINPKTAQISTAAKLDRESLASDDITLVIRASDTGGRYSDVKVMIKVVDVNDNAPRFRSESVRVRVKEDTNQGSEVTRLIATDDDQGQNAEVKYRIQSGAFDKFVIEPDTGIMRVAPGQVLDREMTNTYNVIVVANDNGPVTSLSSTCFVTIDIDDVNDCRPKFVEPWLQVTIKENSLINTTIAQVLATDIDESPNLHYSIVSFTAYDAQGRLLVPGSRRRSIKKSQKSDYDIIMSWFHLNSTTGEIKVASSKRKTRLIDRELCSSVELNILVRDLASVDEENAEALQPAVVKINIEDENDNPPIFIMTSSNGDVIEIGDNIIVDITEETAIGSVLVSLKAIDHDMGNNGKVVYDVIEGPKVQMRDQESGTLIVASRIDREIIATSSGQAWVNVTVLARDFGFPESKSTKLRVFMRVRDINDNNPEFESKKYKAFIYENATIGSGITKIKATDADAGAYGDVIYRMKGGREMFDIHPVTGLVRLLSPLDREASPEYTLDVTATDNERGAENNRRETTVQLTIAVLDVNDCPPVFTEPRTTRTYSVQENSRVGSFVAVVTAEDPDDGAGAQITYSLMKNQVSKFFNIQEATGHVTIKRPLTNLPRDLENPNLVVIATDGGGLHSNMSIFLDIVDVNDHAPLFEEPRRKEISIFEEEPAGLIVGHVLATDADSGLNGIVRYSFCDVTNNKALNSFFIDEVTGRIITSKRLDREFMSEYSLYICASDLGLPRLRSSAPLTIKLLDRNDNKPEFPKSDNAENGNGAWQQLNIAEDARIGQHVGQVTRAVDRDIGENARTYYHLVAIVGPGQGVFSVQKESGRVYLETSLDREKINKYTLIIRATNEVNITQPAPMKGRKKQDVVVAKRASDEQNDTQPSGLLVTSQTDDVISMMSQEPESLFDPNGDSSLIRVAIEIDDVNDQWPTFRRQEYVTAADVNAKIGTNLIKVEAVDNDIGANGIVTYTITQIVLRSHDNKTKTKMYGAFTVDSQSGEVKTTQLLGDFMNGYFKLSIEARDSANHRDTTAVYIYILQTNEKVKFIMNNPPDVVRRQEEKFSEMLGNITRSRVIVDDIQYHETENGRRDVKRSDVTIRVFNPATMREVKSETVLLSLEENAYRLARLFGDYSIKEITPVNKEKVQSSDVATLRLIIIIMIVILILIVVIFIALYCHMRRRYKREIHALSAGTLVPRGMKLKTGESMMPNTNVYSEAGTNPIWKEKYFRHLERKVTEDDDPFPDDIRDVGRRSEAAPIPVARKSQKSLNEIPEIKPRSRSENDRLKEKCIPRTSTDVWIPQKHPVTSESLQIIMRERTRKKGIGETSEAKQFDDTLKPDQVKVQTHSSMTDESTQIKAKEEKRKRKKEKKSPPTNQGRHSPELSLHSGGTSEDFVRKASLTLHASEVAENIDDDSDVTATNMTSSSSSVTSSISSVNLISDL